MRTRPGLVRWVVGLALAFPCTLPVLAQPTFSRDVAPILWERCGACHRPDGPGPFPLITFGDVVKRAEMIAVVIQSRYMPPWPPVPGHGQFEGERRMKDREIETVLAWIEAGRPEGASDNLPTPPTWPSGWQLGEPDLVLEMTEEFEIPADGPDVFRSFVLPVPIGRTRYVRGFEFRPGNAPVVHHARMLIDPSGNARRRDEHDPGPGFSEGMALGEVFDPDGHWIGWTPGKQPTLRRPELAWSLEPGSDLMLELHLLPTGKPETIRSSLGLYFADSEPVRLPFMLRLGRNDIDIPAGAKNYVIEDSYELPVDIEVLSVYAHAHYLGKSMEGWAALPGGGRKDLLRIDDWSFDWQDEYRYQEPVGLPRGSRIFMRFSYDNSAENPRNPGQPPRRVTYGWKTFEEMGDLWFQVQAKDSADRAVLADDFLRKERLAQVAGLEKQLEASPGDLGRRNDLGYLHLQGGQLPAAIREFDRVVDRDPSNVFALHNLGLAWNLQGAITNAEQAYRAAIEADPTHAPSLSNLAVVLANTGRPDEAEGHLRNCIRAQPRYVEAYGNLGAILVSLGRHEEAVSTYRRAIEINPRFGPAHYNLAGLYLARGEAEAARRHYRAASQTDYDQAATRAREALEKIETQTAP